MRNTSKPCVAAGLMKTSVTAWLARVKPPPLTIYSLLTVHTPRIQIKEIAMDLAQRFWSKVSKNNDGCWLWIGANNGAHDPARKWPYGQLRVIRQGKWS